MVSGGAELLGMGLIVITGMLMLIIAMFIFVVLVSMIYSMFDTSFKTLKVTIIGLKVKSQEKLRKLRKEK